MSNDNKQIVLGVDLDGVCADFYARMREIVAEWFEKDPDDLPHKFSYGLQEWGIEDHEQYESIHRFAVTQRDLFSTSPMIPGARYYLRKLSDEKFRIRIITHRLFIYYFHDRAVSQTMEWLDTNGIPFWDLCFMKDKDQVGADIYIEDNPIHIEKLRNKSLYAICFANCTNEHILDPRAECWEKVYNLVHERIESPMT